MTLTADIDSYAHGRVPRDVRRAQLVEVARELFADGGFGGTSMEQIARQAGVTKPVVYEIFGSKDGIYRALIEQSAGELAQTVAAASASADDPIGKLRAGGAAFFRFAADQRGAFQMLYASDTNGRFADEIVDIRTQQARLVASIIADDARALGHQVDDTQVEAAALAMNGAYEALAVWAVAHPELSPETLAEWIVALVGPGLMQIAASGTLPLPDKKD